MTRPSLDVVVPCYNYGRYLGQCVRSVLRETRLDVRILIIDDASADDTAEVARRLAAEDDRIEVRVHATNRGHIATYNEGLAWAQRDYMLLLSADDLVAPGALMRAVQLMERQPDIAFVFGRANRFRTEYEISPEAAANLELRAPDQVVPGWDFIAKLCHSSMNPVETATAVVRGAVQRQVGGYAPKLTHSADFEMWLRCAEQGRVGEIATVQAYVRLHDANMRNGYCAEDAFGDYLQRRDAFVSFFDRIDDGQDRDALRDVALRSLAANLLWDASRAVEQGRDCSEIVALALEIHPDIRRTAQYRRLTIKRGLRQLLSFRPLSRASGHMTAMG